MNGLIEMELARHLPGGKRCFRVELAKGKSLLIWCELEVDPGGVRDLRRCEASDVEIQAGLDRAVVLSRQGEALRGGQG